MNGTQSIEIPTTEFDVQLLPANARQPGTDAFRQAVSQFIESEFKGFAGWVQIVVDDACIRVAWRSKPEAPSPLNEAVKRLQAGDSARGIQMLRFVLATGKREPDVYYNLGIALSDLGRLDEAERHLREAVGIAPGFTNARVALGVALARQGKHEEAAGELEMAVGQEPQNHHALRNLAACLLQLRRDLPSAERYLRDAVRLQPADQQAWFGLGNVLEVRDHRGEAEEAYKKAIEINPASGIAELARNALGGIAQKEFRDNARRGLRMDAVMYCLAALRKFEGMPMAEVRKIGFEIAVLGTKGISPNKSDVRYQLRSMPGDFSGLELLCFMFVAFKKLDLNESIGFDVEKEYDAARSLFEQKSGE